jgi:hypothetical protein
MHRPRMQSGVLVQQRFDLGPKAAGSAWSLVACSIFLINTTRSSSEAEAYSYRPLSRRSGEVTSYGQSCRHRPRKPQFAYYLLPRGRYFPTHCVMD